MRKSLFILNAQIIFIAAACSATPIQDRKVASVDLPWGLDLASVPEAAAIRRWSDPKYENANNIDLNALERIQIPETCSDKRLYPSHPQQVSKMYHVFRIAEYDNTKLTANSEICKIFTRPSSPDGKKFCLKSDSFEHVIISDTFEDSCGNLYRGFWSVDFLTKDESMGTLFSKGRTLYQNPNSEFKNDMLVGPTYFLNSSDFLFLTAPFQDDLATLKKIKEQSLQSHTYNPQTHLYSPKEEQ